jgi:hypothetical protein
MSDSSPKKLLNLIALYEHAIICLTKHQHFVAENKHGERKVGSKSTGKGCLHTNSYMKTKTLRNRRQRL